MHMNRPTLVELLEAVREHLERKVQPALSDALAYENRVAINVLKILEREARDAPDALVRGTERLQRLLGRDADPTQLNAELCERIAHGDFDTRTDELFEHLYLSALDKLAIDNPRYAACERALGRRSKR